MDFSSQAIMWDSDRRVKRAKLIADQIAEAVEIKKHYNALEFGCGTGLISFNLCDKLNHITCMDTSEGMINALHAKIQQCKVDNMVACQCDINASHTVVPKYDLIFTSMALHHIVDIETTLVNLYRSLNIGGYLCIIELDEDDGSFHKLEEGFNGHNGFNQNDLNKVLGKIGFKEVDSFTFYSDQKIMEEVSVNYSLFIMTGKKMTN